MFRGRGRRVVLFVGLYLLFSAGPYLALNWEIVVRILDQLFPPSPLVAVAVLGGALVLLAALVRASEGVDRYAQFLAAPTDWLSILVNLSFVFAAASWWAVPEIVLAYYGRIDLNLLYFLVFLGHVPMLLFLSLMTAVGFARTD